MSFKQWLAQRRLNKKTRQTVESCHQIYQNIPSFNLAKQARSDQQLFSYEYIYGEIDFDSYAQVLSYCTIKPNSIFYDLGSGAGKAVVCAALLYDFKRACGIEHLELLHECAQQASKHLEAYNIHFYLDNLLTYNWLDADILFINASTFIGDFWHEVLSRLKQLKSGTQIIVVSKQLPAESFSPIYDDFLLMSWGYARVGIYTVY